MSRFVIFLFALLAALAGIFLLFGDFWESLFQPEKLQILISQYGSWVWLAGLVLLALDLFLPIPNTLVMSVLGWHYGWIVGGILSALGSWTAGLIAYGSCRAFGNRAATWLAGEKGLEQGKTWFADPGKSGLMVAISRGLPLFSEAIACLAGLFRMRIDRYMLASALGSIPLGMIFAGIGAMGREEPIWAFWASVSLPGLIYLGVILKRTRMKKSSPDAQD